MLPNVLNSILLVHYFRKGYALNNSGSTKIWTRGNYNAAICAMRSQKVPKRLQHVFVSFKAENGTLRLPPKHFKIMARKKDILV